MTPRWPLSRRGRDALIPWDALDVLLHLVSQGSKTRYLEGHRGNKKVSNNMSDRTYDESQGASQMM